MSAVHPRQGVFYPESDGKPRADDTKQLRWIWTIYTGIASLFKDDPNVFVAGDLLWYPIEGDNKTRTAPDVMVVFGRPKGDRPSYKQWEEDGVAPQVVFEVLRWTEAEQRAREAEARAERLAAKLREMGIEPE